MDDEQSKILYQNQLDLQKQIDEQIVLNQEQALALAQVQQQQQKRTLPASDLDLNLMLTDTMWGNPNISPIIKDKLNKQYIVTDPSGKQYVSKEDLWGLLGFYTRDLRLGNLSGSQITACEFHLNLANDFLKEGFVDPFLICLSRVATPLELSQSRNGFLRKRHSSFTTENMQGSMEPPKRSMFGTKQKEQ